MPLFSGIGNIIQSLPFAYEMKKRYGKIYAFNKSMDFIDTKHLVSHYFTEIFRGRNNVPKDYHFYKAPERRSKPEYECWFIDNNESIPDKFVIPHIGYELVDKKYKVVIWPECKANWPCKMWPYFSELIKLLTAKFGKIAIVGTNRESMLYDVDDYRTVLPLAVTGGLIKNADIFIGNEGGISHYAAALGVKTYIIMGCTDPIKNLPPNNAIPISLDLDCQPCQFRNLLEEKTDKTIIMHGCEHRNCLNKLTAKKVYDECTRS